MLGGPAGSVNCMDWLGYLKHDMPKSGTLWDYILETKVYLCPADSLWRDPALNVCWIPAYATHSSDFLIPIRNRACFSEKGLALFPTHR
ncbi:MAG: hypothetical protein ABIF71_12180 [Planctomycetota bacterium]